MEGPADDPGEFDPRVRIYSETTGDVRPVRKDAVQGLDEFVESWEHNVFLPHPMEFSGWQMADDEHPAGEGRPGYRIVHKTIRSFVLPQVLIPLTNLQIRFTNGPVTWGEPRFREALASRAAGAFILPEWGTLELSQGEASYKWEPNVQVSIEAYQETTPDGNYLEILYVLPEGEWAGYYDMVAAGRAGVATMTMMLDFLYGELVLGPVLTEEVGELFDDWHWNRLIGGRTVAMESQARLEALDGNVFLGRVGEAIARHQDKSEEERNRIKISAQWYWRADAEPELVQRYIAYWLCIEALELGENANIAPVKDAVARLLGVERREVSDPLGRIYSVRNGLVHGSRREVGRESLERVRAVAVALLELHSLGSVSAASLAGLRWSMDFAGP